jgi:hypothetical protein
VPLGTIFNFSSCEQHKSVSAAKKSRVAVRLSVALHASLLLLLSSPIGSASCSASLCGAAKTKNPPIHSIRAANLQTLSLRLHMYCRPLCPCVRLSMCPFVHVYVHVHVHFHVQGLGDKQFGFFLPFWALQKKKQKCEAQETMPRSSLIRTATLAF